MEELFFLHHTCCLRSESCVQVKDHFGSSLDRLQAGDTAGVMVSDDAALHLYVNGVDQGIVSHDIPPVVYALVDLYGQCEQITIVTDDDTTTSSLEHREKADMEDGKGQDSTCHTDAWGHYSTWFIS